MVKKNTNENAEVKDALIAATSGGDRRLRQLDRVSDASTYKLDVSE